MLYDRCTCIFNVEEINKDTGKKEVVTHKFITSSLSDTSINKFILASSCKNYTLNQKLIDKIKRFYRDLIYWEWEKEKNLPQ